VLESVALLDQLRTEGQPPQDPQNNYARRLLVDDVATLRQQLAQAQQEHANKLAGLGTQAKPEVGSMRDTESPSDVQALGSSRSPMFQLARDATTELRDAAREGLVIGFRKRDLLVLAIHRAIDAGEAADADVATLRQQLAQAQQELESVHGAWQAEIEANRAVLAQLAQAQQERDALAEGKGLQPLLQQRHEAVLRMQDAETRAEAAEAQLADLQKRK